MSIGVYRQWDPSLFNDALEQRHISPGVFLFLKEGAGSGPGSVVDSQQQGQPGAAVLQPGVRTAI
jgi:hypothetical protein